MADIRQWEWETGDFFYSAKDDTEEVSDDLLYKEIHFTEFIIEAVIAELEKANLCSSENQNFFAVHENAYLQSKLRNLRNYLTDLQYTVALREIDHHHKCHGDD